MLTSSENLERRSRLMSTFVYCCLNDLKKQIINLRVNKVTAGKYQYYLVFSSFITFFYFLL